MQNAGAQRPQRGEGREGNVEGSIDGVGAFEEGKVLKGDEVEHQQSLPRYRFSHVPRERGASATQQHTFLAGQPFR
jgi:hypothetical protein